MVVRHIEMHDITEVLQLMYQLAKFEGYAEDFTVTEQALKHRVFIQQDVHILVALHQKNVIGILVYYFLPFTYDLSPWINIKELYVQEKFRGQHAGNQLMQHLAKIATEKGSSRIQWLVLDNNLPAQSFYKSLGAKPNDTWNLFNLHLPEIKSLAAAE